jgi:Xaa-Pro dipeptidase
LSFRESEVRIAAANIIESPADLKQLAGRFVGLLRHMTSSDNLETTFRQYLDAVCTRTAHALAAAGYDGLVVHSGSLLTVFEDDRTYPFEVHAPFKVWVPLTDAPDCFVHFEPGRRPKLIFHSPVDYWYKPAQLPTAYWTPYFDISPVPERDAARAALPGTLGRTAYIGDTFPGLEGWGLAATNPPELMRRLDFDRAAKLPYELQCLRAASRLGARGHLAAAEAFKSGATEFEIELAFLKACGQREQDLPYNPIIALNESGAVLHYQVLEHTSPAERRSLLIDAGAEFAGYASDITRTYSLHDSDFAALINRMNDLQQRLCSELRAGVDWRDVHLRAHALTGALLRDADITTCGTDEAVATGTTSVFLPHGIGHLLGLEVHDAGGFARSAEGGDIARPDGHPYLRLTRVLQPDFVVTVEPGIYFIDSLLNAARADKRASRINWARVDSFKPFGGIRIEDDVAITPTGCENLTRQAFSAVAAS